jgi:hypothetical protein
MKRALLAIALGAVAMMASASVGVASEARGKPQAATQSSLKPTGGRYVRKRHYAPRGYRRIGFYSYRYRDVINTYGMAYAPVGSLTIFRDPYADQQSIAGPFDHGFFFDSGIRPRGGNAPYLH